MVLVTVLLGTFTLSLNNSALNLAVAELMRTFDASAVQVSWVVTLFLISMAMTMPLTGFLADRFGKKRIYLTGLWVFLAGSLAGAASPGLHGLILARGVQGIAAGLMIPLSLSMLFAAYPLEKRGRTIGIWGFAVMLAPAIGPGIGGLLLELSHWQALFLMNVPTSVMGLVCGYRYLPGGGQDTKRRFDTPGFMLVTLGVGVVMFSLGTISSLDDLLTASHLLLLCLGVLLLAAFVRVERRVAQPLLDLSVFRIPDYSVSVVIACVQAVATFGCILLIPLWMQQVQGYNAFITGLVFLPTAIASACCVAYAGAGRLVDRSSPRLPVVFGLLVTAASLLGMASLGMAAPLWAICMVMTLRGIGLGFSSLSVTTIGLNALPNNRVSQASAMNNISRRITSSLGVVVLSIYYEMRTAQQLIQGVAMKDASMTALSEAFTGIACLILVVTPIAFSLQAPRSEATPAHD